MNLTQRIVLDLGIPYDSTARILGITEEEVIDLEREERRALNAIESAYVPMTVSEARESVGGAIDVDYADMLRRDFLRESIKEAKLDFFGACKSWHKVQDKSLSYWPTLRIQQLETKLWKLNRDLQVLIGKSQDISPERIALARQYPISNLVKANSAGMAKCPFHNDKSPSMDIRKNFYFCYGCGESGDVINFVMKSERLNFKQAVDRLCA